VKRRQRKILQTVLPGLGLVALALWLTLDSPFRDKPKAYAPDEENSDVTRSLDIAGSEGHTAVHFVDQAIESGLDFVHFRDGVRTSRLPEDMGSGAAWGDYDNDGDADLFLVDLAHTVRSDPEFGTAGEPGRGSRLYENIGQGRFRDVSDLSGTAEAVIGMGAAWVDLDSDGFLDLITSGYRFLHLYHNQADGTFREMSREAGFLQSGFSSGLAVGDYDLDGDLDVYVCGYVDYDDAVADQIREATLQYRTAVPVSLNPSSFSDSPNRLYRNDGDLRFVDVAKPAGVDGVIAGRLTGKSLGAVWSDFNEDGWPDLYVANDVSNNHLFLNRQDGTFEEMGAIAWVADPRGSMGLAIGDFDNDNDTDIFVSHWIAQENALYVNQSREIHGPGLGPAALKAGDVNFADRADVLGLGQSALDYVGWGTSFFDFDNDGHLDLFVANGSTFESSDDPTRLTPMRSILYRNLGGKAATAGESAETTSVIHRGFADCAEFAGGFFEEEHVARGFSPCDFDADGDLDLLVSVFGEQVRLLRNENETGHHWLDLRLRSPGPNRFSIGADVYIETPGFARHHSHGSEVSYLSGSVTDIHIGLGVYAGEVQVRVSWLGGGTQSFSVERTDCTVLLTEGVAEVTYIQSLAATQREKHPLGATGRRLKGEAYLTFQKTFREATQLRIARQYGRSESLYVRVLELDPEHLDARYYLGSVLFDQSRYAEAAEAWSDLLAISPKSTKGHFMMGVLHACPLPGAPTNFDLAQDQFSEVYELNKEDSGVVLRLGEVALLRGDAVQAREFLEKGVGSNFSSADGHYLLSYVLWEAGDTARAAEEMDLALEYASREGVPERAASGALTEGDIEDPTMLRLADTYRVRPLANRLIGLNERAGDVSTTEFCRIEANVLRERVAAIRKRHGSG